MTTFGHATLCMVERMAVEAFQIMCEVIMNRSLTAIAVRHWLKRVSVETLFIESGEPWENGYVKSFNSKLRDEPINGEIFYTMTKALIEQWRRHYNQIRPHRALSYRPPAPKQSNQPRRAPLCSTRSAGSSERPWSKMSTGKSTG